jgi:hypothetical protein
MWVAWLIDGAVAQLGERLLCKQEVIGSIPFGSTSLRTRFPVYAPGSLASRERTKIENELEALVFACSLAV